MSRKWIEIELDEAKNENRVNEHEDEELERINRKKVEEILRMQNQKTLLANAKPIVLSDSNFFSEISKYPLAVVDFWAPWCGPCRMVGPIIEELARDYLGKVTFGKLNVDENPSVSNQFQVQSIPTILIFKNGQAVDGVIGARPRPFLESKIKAHLTGDNTKTSAPYR